MPVEMLAPMDVEKLTVGDHDLLRRFHTLRYWRAVDGHTMMEVHSFVPPASPSLHPERWQPGDIVPVTVVLGPMDSPTVVFDRRPFEIAEEEVKVTAARLSHILRLVEHVGESEG